MAGKGSRRRPPKITHKEWSDNYAKAFGRKKCDKPTKKAK